MRCVHACVCACAEADLNNVLGRSKVHPFNVHVRVGGLPLPSFGLGCVMAPAVHVYAIDLVDKLNAFERPLAVRKLNDD
jgi:hypothetical protein